jgi:cell division protein ZapA (FtsZ GTPase activity inhibitor)
LDKEKKSARVSILGLELRVKTDTDSAYVEEIARFVERRVREASTDGNPPSVGVALLAAMNIADELQKLRRETEGGTNAQDRRLKGLLKRVEEALDA